jgi:aryl-alcohol dehydrogenase-like predicted oxidoreductase
MAPPSQELEPPINPERFMYDYSAAATRQSLVESRQRPGIDRIDIAHIHDVIELAGGISHIDEARHETYPVLAELREQGTISAIGVGTQVNRVLTELGEAADFSCFLVACRYTLLDQSALDSATPRWRRSSRGRSAIELRENLRLMQVEIPVELWRDLRNEGLVDPRSPLQATP